ncbi:hypothetical protein EU527_15170 [Candidatus Thorarchaeota archaeon]|nr:MAG: hypothetical protein EU527_15170 [Candidatus Thorarchaeota archaeon]
MSTRDGAITALVQFDTSSTSMKAILRELQTTSTDSPEFLIKTHFLPLSVIKRRNTIDYLLIRTLDLKNILDLDIRERNTLRLLLYETKWLGLRLNHALSIYPQIKPNHVKAIKHAIETDLDSAVENLATVNKLSLKFSHPTFLVKTLLDNLPLDETIQLLKKNNENRTYYVRLNRLLCTDSSILDSFENVKLMKEDNFDGLFRVIEGIETIIASKLFQEGYLLIQDKASILAVEALDPQSNQIIWDSCAAPGMKTQLITEKLKGTGKIIATDVYRDRVVGARNRSFNLGASQIEWVQSDSTNPTILDADKILIDAPCTSTGILQSYPSFKWRLNKDTLFSLMTIQHKLLDGIINRYAQRPGTEIVFSTCSILPHEGESQIDSILTKHRIELLDPILPNATGYKGFKCSTKVTRLLPHRHDTSGFFIARLRIMH